MHDAAAVIIPTLHIVLSDTAMGPGCLLRPYYLTFFTPDPPGFSSMPVVVELKMIVIENGATPGYQSGEIISCKKSHLSSLHQFVRK